MPHISITRLRLRSPFLLPAFIRAATDCVEQARAADGFIEGALLPEGWFVFWTRSTWRDLEAMKAYRASGAHLTAMPKLMEWCDEASVTHWEGETERDWDAICARLMAEGRLSKVRRPSKAHASGRLAKPIKRFFPERVLVPTAQA